MNNYELEETYPLERIAGTEPPHDISKGLQKHWPLAYANLGRDRVRRDMPWILFAMIVFGGLMIARAM